MAVKMHNVGRDGNNSMPVETPSRVTFPSISLDEDQLKAVKNYKVDDKIEMVVKGVIKESGRQTYRNNKLRVEIEITAIGLVKDLKTARELLAVEASKSSK